jgi:hypothetical protein
VPSGRGAHCQPPSPLLQGVAAAQSLCRSAPTQRALIDHSQRRRPPRLSTSHRVRRLMQPSAACPAAEAPLLMRGYCSLQSKRFECFARFRSTHASARLASHTHYTFACATQPLKEPWAPPPTPPRSAPLVVRSVRNARAALGARPLQARAISGARAAAPAAGGPAAHTAAALLALAAALGHRCETAGHRICGLPNSNH